jgi:hypothetical protein
MGVVVGVVTDAGDSRFLERHVFSGGKTFNDDGSLDSDPIDVAESLWSNTNERHRIVDVMLSVPTVSTVEGVPGDAIPLEDASD